MEKERLQKYIASTGFASRRKAEDIIVAGRVTLNGERVTELGTKVSSDDVIEIDGKKLTKESKKVYIVLNKPIGYVSTADDQFGRATVLDLVKDVDARIYPVGRLDYDTSGLIFLTNDGDLTYALTHPKHSIRKVYIADVLGIPSSDRIDFLQKGISIDGSKTAPSKIEVLGNDGKNAKLRITIHEGKNRQVRKMLEMIEHPVISLTRVEEGEVRLENLELGKWRFLKKDEIKRLKTLCHLS